MARIDFLRARGGTVTSTKTSLPYVDLTVVGERVFGNATAHVSHWSQQLARSSGVSYLCVRFTSSDDDARFIGADIYPRLESVEIAQALVEYCTERRWAC